MSSSCQVLLKHDKDQGHDVKHNTLSSSSSSSSRMSVQSDASSWLQMGCSHPRSTSAAHVWSHTVSIVAKERQIIHLPVFESAQAAATTDLQQLFIAAFTSHDMATGTWKSIQLLPQHDYWCASEKKNTRVNHHHDVRAHVIATLRPSGVICVCTAARKFNMQRAFWRAACGGLLLQCTCNMITLGRRLQCTCKRSFNRDIHQQHNAR
jgi:hypothetical protein